MIATERNTDLVCTLPNVAELACTARAGRLQLLENGQHGKGGIIELLPAAVVLAGNGSENTFCKAARTVRRRLSEQHAGDLGWSVCNHTDVQRADTMTAARTDAPFAHPYTLQASFDGAPWCCHLIMSEAELKHIFALAKAV